PRMVTASGRGYLRLQHAPRAADALRLIRYPLAFISDFGTDTPVAAFCNCALRNRKLLPRHLNDRTRRYRFMYKLTARQILMVAFASAVFAVVGVIGFQQIYNRLPFGSAANVAPLANITDPALATDEQNNIEVYKAISPGVVNISSTTMVRGYFGLLVEPE